MNHAPASLEYWYEFGSTYSYPSTMRVERLAKAAGVEVQWKPFLLGPIFANQGWKDSPFNLYPAKGKYMWRDLDRICAREGLPLRLPPVRFPQNGLKAARIALLGGAAGWTPTFSRAVFTANFAEQRDIADDAQLAAILDALDVGLDVAATMALAGGAENKAALRAQTEEAVAKGIFGAPSMIVGEELFWGNDRLEEAFAWATR
ncbi:MAG TPA: 2-hydroxychromene-2-carboxylate isomerase [Polyangiaceae bacterium]|jgi:2-hydroxychromene-2-carboxylate isomerase